MGDMRAELGQWMGRVEAILNDRRVLNGHGERAEGVEDRFPREIEEALDGFIEDPIELVALLKISKKACAGLPVSPAILHAAHLMAREIHQALEITECANDNVRS